MDKNFFFILLAMYLLPKTDFPMCGPYLFGSHRSPQMYDLLSAYFTNRVIKLLRNGICVFKRVICPEIVSISRNIIRVKTRPQMTIMEITV